jgi:hypothetical protein
MNQRLKLYTFDNYYEYEWLWCENWMNENINKHNCLSGSILLESSAQSLTMSENTDPVGIKHIICNEYFNILALFFYGCMFKQRKYC